MVNVVAICVSVQLVVGGKVGTTDCGSDNGNCVHGIAPLWHTVTGVLVAHAAPKCCPVIVTVVGACPAVNVDGLTDVIAGSAFTVNVSVLLFPFGDAT